MKAQDILTFWIGAVDSPEYGESRAFWFKKSPEVDLDIKNRFEDMYKKVIQGEEIFPMTTPQAYLAKIILLDQFSRNMYRDTPASFSSDPISLTLAQKCIDLQFDIQLPAFQRVFVYLPFMHSEDLAVQETSVLLFEKSGNSAMLDYAIRHRDIIARFHRFPHRNAILGRTSTEEEIAFLKEPNSSF